jgi:hypothetical protein
MRAPSQADTSTDANLRGRESLAKPCQMEELSFITNHGRLVGPEPNHDPTGPRLLADNSADSRTFQYK